MKCPPNSMIVDRVEHSDDGKTVTVYGHTESGNTVVMSAPAGTMVTRLVVCDDEHQP